MGHHHTTRNTINFADIYIYKYRKKSGNRFNFGIKWPFLYKREEGGGVFPTTVEKLENTPRQPQPMSWAKTRWSPSDAKPV